MQVDSDITEDSYEMTSDPQTEDSDGYIPHETPKRRSGNISRRASQTQPTIKSKVAIETAPEAHKEDPPLVTSDDIFARPGSPLTSICDSPSPFNDDQSTHQKSKSRLVFDGIELISRPPFLSHKRRDFGPIVATQGDQSSKPKRRLSVDSVS